MQHPDGIYKDINLAKLTDSYKVTHWQAYPPKTNKIYSYYESRGGAWKDQVFYGLDYLIREFLTRVVTKEQVDEAREFWSNHFGTDNYFNYKAWMDIATKHGGRLPLRIKAVPEGTVVPYHNVLMTVENTDPSMYWLTNWVETILCQIWYPMTVATNSRELKKLWLHYLELTGDPATVDFKHHDFGYRGSTSYAAARLGGSAHLTSFMGTDTAAGIEHVAQFHKRAMAGFSVFATEHSTMTAWGENHEFDAVRHILRTAPFDAIISVVGDSWDIYRFAHVISTDPDLKQKILSRAGKFVVRPDSGSPATTSKEVMDILGAGFGYTTNSKGYKVLPIQVGQIWGDGIDYNSSREILENLRGAGWSADNIVLGSGAGLLQKFDRDTLSLAFKCSYAEVDGIGRDVFKRPVTDTGKSSKRGRLALGKNEYGNFMTVPESEVVGKDHLELVYENGEMQRDYASWVDIRQRAAV